ncbi:nuclear transport factor 2 family protein [Pseudorhodoplanes sp.]|uniref:nuclear transport factor 2 family protein n=1 Tax=Pseudorhodoplanes sp. TaxID=1934341 RepID=UPI003D12A334
MDQLESQDAIRRLKARYMQACDDRLGRAIADLFWPDGIWEATGPSTAGQVVGHDAIAAMFEASPRRLTFTTHYLTNEEIAVEGDHGAGSWKLFEPCTFQDRLALWMGGRYVDAFERRGGEWRFAHLKLHIEFRTPFEQGWVKERFADLSGNNANKPATGPIAIRAIDHVSYTVPNLRQAVDFFVNVLGARALYERRSGAFGGDLAERFDVRAGASFELAKLELAGTSIELFEYRDAGGPNVTAKNSTCGGGHFAMLVDDFDAALEQLGKIPDVRLLGQASVLADGHPLAGRRWIYFLTPWGLQLELVSRIP